MLPGSNESGALRQSKVSVPPLCVDGLTTLVIPAPYAGPAAALPPPLLELLLPLLLHAASMRAAAAPNAASPKVLRLLIG